ncbi:TrbI/VirB10 family protein [Photobacterium damselae subsp. piscicida]|uniref:TrbI/VirB10 family protein n=1 Tax=Photobacterium damselae TaxID=38293 RepID=UPI00107649E2|nr:TrbI/VirB10 family protein [Photobacterium damselae]TFZ62421.1 TrbI/VirB10 family protein [Photobacterium damselae subsp. piscicida]
MEIKSSIAQLSAGGRKIANTKIFAISMLLVFIILVVTFAVIGMKGTQSETKIGEETKPITQAGLDVTQSLNQSLAAAPREAVVPSQQAIIEQKQAVVEQQTKERTTKDENSLENKLKEEMIKDYLTLKRAKAQAYLDALNAPTHIAFEESKNQTQSDPLTQAKAQLAALEATGLKAQQDAQAHNRTTSVLDGYLDNSKKPLGTPYTLAIGSLIPAALVGALNSDIAGTVTATLTQNVYDSATGAILLLPQGTKLVGQYQGQVAFGQERLPVQWYRVNFPDGSTVNLRGMDGVDVGGQTGFAGEVDNHYWRLFGQSTLLGLIAGGTTAAVSTKSNANEVSPAQTVANGVISQYAQVGTSLIQKNLQISPTITVPSGYEFNIILTKDVVLPPYQGQ